ncbi:MAG: MarR family transcriptional regulator [candidate division WOR-3 bacterium]
MKLLTSVEALGQEFSFSQMMILLTLLRLNRTSMNQLAQTLGLSRANASGLVDRLVRKGLIERRRSEQDRRLVLIQLTSEGQRLAHHLARQNRQGLRRMMKRIPEADLKVFIQTLEQLALGLADSD